MKKFFTYVMAVVLSAFVLNVNAEVVTPEVAKETADNFLTLDENWRGANDATVTLVERDGIPAYYIVEYNGGGWALVSAQSSTSPMLGYNTDGNYVAPAPMQWFLDLNAQYIVDLSRIEGDVKHEGWRRAMQRKPAEDITTYPDIEPMVMTDLNQSNPYNKYCPTIDSKKSLVGCVAVAMTQAMMVQEFPERPVGKFSYTDNDGGTGTHTIDFDKEADYDWQAVINCDQTGNYDEAARILYHAGVAARMMYGLSFSGAYMNDACEAMHRNFGYDKEKLQLVFRYEHSDDEWMQMLLDDLLLGRVVIYQGAANEKGEGGHSWNIDGWKRSTQMVHCNWGWGGHGNGYFSIDNLNDDYQGISLNYHHGAILGVGTPTTAPYGIKLSTTSFAKGTPAGTALADVIVACEDAEAQLSFETFGPNNVAGKPTTSPYVVEDGKLKTTQEVADSNKFKYLKIKVTNTSTGEFFEKEFSINITSGVSSVMSDAMRVYPSVVENSLTIEVPMSGGEYAIYSVSGVQVAAGEMAGYTTQLDLSSLAAGTYILRYTHSEGVGVKTFIKK